MVQTWFRIALLVGLCCLTLSAFGCGADAVTAPAGRDISAGSLPPSSGQRRTASESAVELQLDTTVSVAGLDLRWTDLADSRCPLGVTCVWEGEVRVTLEVSRGGETAAEVDLTLRSGRESKPVEVFGRRFRLLRVEPVPVHGMTRNREDYRAVIEVFDG